MVKKTLLVTVVLFGIYALFIGLFRPHWSVTRHQNQYNQFVAEKYLFDNQTAQNILVGSSLTARLSAPQNFYNLAFSGMGVFDGLALLRMDERPLRTVYIEMNVVDRDEDVNFTSTLTNPVLAAARRTFLSMRADKQPLSIAAEQTENLLSPGLRRLATASPTGTTASTLFPKMLKTQQANYTQHITDEVFAKRFAKLKQAVALLQARGVQVVFYELPIDAHLCGLPKAVSVRTAFKHYFPATEYHYIALPPCGEYQTTDGVHLTPESAAKYMRYFEQQNT